MHRFAILALLLLPLAASADDASERDRRARAALALSKAESVAVAPAPRAALPKCYAKGHKEACADTLPLVVFVGCDLHPVEGAVVAKWDSYPGVKSPAVVVGYPVGDRIVQDSVIACPAQAGELKRAVKSAAGKSADVQPMPSQKIAPVPLDWTKISADVPAKAACACGDSCPCDICYCALRKPTVPCPDACPANAATSGDGLGEVNAKRAARGLKPYIRDEGLTAAARGAAEYRAARLMFGHTANDFQFLPAGFSADAAGCAAYPPAYGWMSCAIYDNYSHAGAVWVMGSDGKRYCHLFVRNGGPAPVGVQSVPAVEVSPVFVSAPTTPAGGWQLAPGYSTATHDLYRLWDGSTWRQEWRAKGSVFAAPYCPPGQS